MSTKACACAGAALLCGWAAAAGQPVREQPSLEDRQALDQASVDSGRLEPLRVAPMRLEAGRFVMDGPWQPYDPSASAPRGTIAPSTAFDCIGLVHGLAELPSFNLCPTNCPGPDAISFFVGARWPVVFEDMKGVLAGPCTPIESIDLAFTWSSTQDEPLIVVFAVFDGPLSLVGSDCSDPRDSGLSCGGRALAVDYGIQAGGSVQAVYSRVVGLSSFGMTLPSRDLTGDGLPDGSYAVIFAREVTGDVVTVSGANVAPAFYATSDITGDGRPGRQNQRAVLSTLLASQVQCVNTTFGSCLTTPAGVALAFSVLSCPGDLNHDGYVDALDYDWFVNRFMSSNPEADVNSDCFLDAADFDMFVRAFMDPCN